MMYQDFNILNKEINMSERIYGFNYIMIVMVFFSVFETTYGREPKNKSTVDLENSITSNERGWWNSIAPFSGNTWNLKITNDGSFGHNVSGVGGEWPRGTNNSMFWSSGLWIGVTNENGDPRVSGKKYGSDFRPGEWDDGEPWNDDANNVKLANRLLGNTNYDFNWHSSYESWPVDKGAPWTDNNGDGVYDVASGDRPYMPLDQSIFTIYNDSETGGGFGGESIGAEVRQLVYGGASSHDATFAQVFFVQYEILNRSDQTWYSPYFGFFMDADIGPNYSNDLGGSISSENLVYAYNGDLNEDGFSVPPAVGMKFLGNNPGDFGGEHNLNVVSGQVLCGSCIDGTDGWDPWDDYSAYARLSGLQNNNEPYYNPLTGENTRWIFDGDPVNQSGWIDGTQEDKRILLSVASNDLAPGQSIKFTIAVGVGSDQNNLESINHLRSTLNAAEIEWGNDFSSVAYIDRPILEVDCCNGSFPDMSFNSINIGQVQTHGYNYLNSGNEVLNMDFSSDNSSITISQPSASINSGDQSYIEFSYIGNEISSFSEHNVPNDFSSIQSAIDNATQTLFGWGFLLLDNDDYADLENQGGTVSYLGGDVINVSPGTYYEQLTVNKGISLVGSGAGETILDGNNSHRLVYVDNHGGSFSITGFTIQNGYFPDYWGENGSSGGIMVWNSDLHIAHNHFLNNKAYAGGGLYVYSGSTGLIERNLFIGNDNIQQDTHEVHSRAVRLQLSGNNQDEVLKFYNNTIYTNSEWDYNGTGWRTLRVNGNSPQVRIVNNIVATSDNTPSAIYAENYPLIMYNLSESYIDGGFDTWGNPNYQQHSIFNDPQNGDFTLFANSLAIDGGDPDLDNDGITWENDPDDQDIDGSRLDVGYGHDRDPNIAEIRQGQLGNTYTAMGIINSNNQSGGSYTGLSMQDHSAGIVIYIDSETHDPDVINLKPGDEVRITGVLGEYRSLLQLQPETLDDVEILSEHNSLPHYQIISISDFNTDPESFESELIHFPFVSIESEGWPLNEGSNGFFTISDGQSATNVFIDGDFDIDGNPAPYNPISMSGLGNQYDNYQLKPQSYLDINLMLDGGFEVADYTGNGWQNLPHHWEFFPESASWGSPCVNMVRYGDQMFNSSDEFIPSSGNFALKLWGLGGGENDYGSGSENNIFQNFEGDHILSEGTEVTIDAELMSHVDNWLGQGQGQNNAKLFFKYFTYDENNELMWHSGKWSNPFDNSFDSNSWHQFSLKDTIPGGIDVMQIGVTYYQLNGDGGEVYVDNLSARVDRSLPKIYAQHSDIIHGESGLVDIMLEGDFQPLTAIDLTFSGFHNILEFMEIIADETSLMGQLDWMIVENNTENELITASVGTQSISQSGKLFSIRVNVDDALESQFVPFDVIHFQGNENFNEFNTQSGGVQVVWGPDSEFSSDNVTGDYPLTVSFNDQSIQGTYPINSWNWNFGDGFIRICSALKELALKYPKVPFVYPVHLNPNVIKPVNEILKSLKNIYLIKPLEYEPFVYLMKHSYLVLTDSGGIQEEAPSLGKPVLVMRDVTERPEAVKAGTVELVGSNHKRIVQSVSRLLDDKKQYQSMSRAHNPYGDGLACKRIVDVLRNI